jgi:Ca-activated chloride channel family protein
MSFVKMKYLPYVIIAVVILAIIQFAIQKKYFTWIQEHWFKKPSQTNLLSRLCYFLGFATLIIALLDLRGAPTKIESSIPDQKTIIIVDSSASMLVEDVRPNRLKRALLLARHFIKSSAGHQIAVVIFSDTQKRLIPFTDDLDLLDARVAALENINIRGGGSQIGQAIQESIQYFKTDEKTMKEPSGNILLLTDSEDNGDLKDLKVPDGVNLAAVGVGTTKGGRIPMRQRNGRLAGYKRFKGQDVISKLDESFLKRLGGFAKNYKYWIALSYNMPTKEILNFFGRIHEGKLKKGTTTVRPVLGHRVILTGIVFFILASFLNVFKSWSVVASLLMFGLISSTLKVPSVHAQMEPPKKEEPQFTEDQLQKLEQMRQGQLSSDQKLALASDLFSGKLFKEGITIMKEVEKTKQKLPWQAELNLGNALCITKNYPEGLKRLADLRSSAPDEVKKIIDQNIYNLLQEKKKDDQQQKKQQQQQKNKDQKDQDQKNQQQQDQQQQNQQQKGESKNDQKGQSKDQENKNKNEQDKQDQQKKDQKEKNKDKQNKDKQNQDQQQKQAQKPQSLKDREEEIRKNRKMIKVPAILKQIMSDDRNLQKKYWKTSTKSNSFDKKDW